MSADLTAEQTELVEAAIREGIHTLFLRHPEYVELGVAVVAEIYTAGAVSGARACLRVIR